MSPAGTAGGTAVVLSRLGADVVSVGAVGTDPIADVLLALLAREGVNVGDGPQGRPADLRVGPPRAPQRRPPGVALHRRERRLHLDDLAPGALEGITHLHLGGPEFLGGEAAGELLARARAQGAVTSLDVLAPGDPDLLAWIAAALPHTDYLLPNDEQVLGFTGASTLADGARALVDAGVGCVAVTQVAEGRSWSRPTRSSRCRRTPSTRSTRPGAETPSRPGSCAGCRWAGTCAAPPSSVRDRGAGRAGPRHRRGELRPEAVLAFADGADGADRVAAPARAGAGIRTARGRAPGGRDWRPPVLDCLFRARAVKVSAAAPPT